MATTAIDKSQLPGYGINIYFIREHIDGLGKLAAIRRTQMPERDPATGRKNDVKVGHLVAEAVHMLLRAEKIIE